MSAPPVITSPRRPEKLQVTRDPNNPSEVVLIRDGEYICNIPWQVADKLAKLLISTARHAEQYAKANELVSADALLIRTGAPFALTSDPRIRDAAYNEAQWGDARKKMPIRGLTVPSKRRLGTPELIKSKPSKV